MYKSLINRSAFKFSRLQIKSCYSGESVYEVEQIQIQEVNKLIEQSNQKQKTFKSSKVSDRIALVQQAQEYFKQNTNDICIQISQSMGKPLKQAQGEMRVMLARMDALCNMAEAELKDQIIQQDSTMMQQIRREALGTIMCIAPWNYPLITLVNTLVAGVLAGNTVLIKHSPYTATIGKQFEKAFAAEQNIVTDLAIDIPTCQQAMQSPLINMVSFTGSVQSGLSVMEQTIEHHYTYNNRILPVALELGGKDGFYVRHDVKDVKAAAEALVDGAIYNSGQSCCSVERIYVHQKVYDEFVQECLINMTNRDILGDPLHPATTMGPMTLPMSPLQLQQQIEDSVGSGASLLIGGLPTVDAKGLGNFFEPTLIVDCDNGMSVFQEESFGPIVAIGKVQDDQEAINMINDSKYGLTGGIYTNDYVYAQDFASQIDAGTVFMNKCDFLEPYLPWAGRKLSGKGVALSRHAFEGVTQLKGFNFAK